MLVFSLEGAGAAESQHERVLEERVRVLEQRLQQLERRAAVGLSINANGVRSRRTRAVFTAPGDASLSSATRAPSQASSSNTKRADPHEGLVGESNMPKTVAHNAEAVLPLTAPRDSQPALGVGQPGDAPQEAFIFRENAVTLAPRRFEVSTELTYLSNSGFLQIDRALLSNTSIRLGVFRWLEFGLTIPAYSATRSRTVAPFRSNLEEVRSIGDVVLQANARLYEQTASTPGIVVSLATIFPTGTSPYNFDFYQPNPALFGYNPNPTDLTASYLSRGSWGVRTNVQIYKTIDPVIVFAGAGIQYGFPQQFGIHEVQQGLNYLYNFGFSFALSERSTLGFQISGSFQNKLLVNGRRVPESNIEAVSARISLIQRVFQNTFLEPSIISGLTSNAASLGIGLGIRHRF